MGWLSGDLKYALRGIAQHRGFALIAVLSLALGIGANTTIFTLLNGILYRSLPVEDPSTLVAVYTVDPKNPGYLPISYLNYKDYSSRNWVFSNLALYSPITVNLTGMGDPRPLMAHIVSGNYFQTLGVKPIIGRGFLPEEDITPNAIAVTVISYGLWTRLFASDPHVTSRTLTISGRAFAIVGVAPPDFHGINELYGADLWAPIAMYPQIYPSPNWIRLRRAAVFSVVGRLKPDIGMPQAQGAMESVAAQLSQEYPRDNAGRSVKLSPIAEAALNPKDRANYSHTGSIMLVISGIVLLIACANVANLLLARGAGRAKEITVRLAIGASRVQLMRQFLVESVLLSLLGGVVGLLAAEWARSLLWPIRPPAFKWASFRFDLDGHVFAYTFAVALLTGIVFGLVPAFNATRADLASGLKERAGSALPGHGQWRPRAMLVIVQLAFSLVALIGAGLFLRSVEAAMQIDPGFDAAHLGVITFNVADQGYNEARGREFQRLVLERAAAVPGVEAVSMAKDLPFTAGGSRTVLLEGQDNTSMGVGRSTLTSVTYPGYFQTLRIPILSGRDFSVSDAPGSPRVAIVNEAAARHFWPGQEAVGKIIQFAGENLPVQIVGVARNADYHAPGEDRQAMVYLSMRQYYFSYAALYVRAANPAAALTAVRNNIRSIDLNLLLDPETVSTTMSKTVWAQSLSATMLSVFGGLALLLSSIGIYGVMSYTVHQRVREIGVRMALGAEAGSVQLMLLKEGARLVAVGVAVGIAVGLVMSRMLQSMLVGVTAHDVRTFVTAPCILAVVAIAACWLPARRATRIDPAKALRTE